MWRFVHSPFGLSLRGIRDSEGRMRALGYDVPLHLFLGFAVSGIIFMLVLLLVVLRRRIVPSLATTAITVAMIQGIFVQWLSVKLPTGPWGF